MYCLSWNSYKNNICNGFAQLQQREEFVDMTLVAEGHLVKVHKNLISLVSPYIKNIIKLVPCTHPIIFLSNITHEVLCQILEFIYTGEVHVQLEKLNAFVKAAKELQLPGIGHDMSDDTSLSGNSHSNNAPEAIPKSKKNNIINRSPYNAAIELNIDDLIDSNTVLSQSLNNKNDLTQNELNFGHKKNISDEPVNKIQILENREINFGICDADIKTNVNVNSINIDMIQSQDATYNQDMSLATIMINGQSASTTDALSTVNSLELIENRHHEYETSEAAVETNNMSNILDTNMLSLQTDDNNLFDLSNSVTVGKTDDINNFDDFLKFPDTQNLTQENNTNPPDQTSDIIYPNKGEAPPVYSLDLSTSVIPQQYTVSNRGSVQMILNRYLYSVQYSANYGAKRRWRCIDYRLLHCKAYVDTMNDKITKRKNCHTHPYHDSKILKKLKANLVFGAFSTAIQEMKKRNNMGDVVQIMDSE